ncbi:hypothetical protein C8N35_11411 [Breoghania corrubedonensis]|uniref:DUF1365 family protein n=2 Tax=Breoghania corrubedonensis TaxID=665038 RepID=A0A2T5US70_9HYPH|nr:hypothetical protein C8N35_11411 [Breoghania corrubedonensis]
MITEALYSGTVVHTRLRPCSHTLRYKVFALLFDCDELAGLTRRLRLFSHNRFNLFSFYDRDHGDGTPIRSYLQGLAAQSGHGQNIRRFVMLCYPRILGYAFNPLTVYFGLDTEERARLVVYEVNNTFGQRKTYVIPVADDERGLIFQSCRKEFYVSPFNPVEGTYSFRVTPPGEALTVGVALKNTSGPVLKTHFRAKRNALSDRNLLRALGRTGWMTAKVMIAIHYEAARLWLKGLRLAPRPPAPDTPVTFAKSPRESS